MNKKYIAIMIVTYEPIEGEIYIKNFLDNVEHLKENYKLHFYVHCEYDKHLIENILKENNCTIIESVNENVSYYLNNLTVEHYINPTITRPIKCYNDYISKYKDTYNYEFIIKIRPDVFFTDKLNLDLCSNDKINGNLRAYYGPPRTFKRNECIYRAEINPTPINTIKNINMKETGRSRQTHDSKHVLVVDTYNDNEDFFWLCDWVFIVPNKLFELAFNSNLELFDNKGFWYAEFVQGLLWKSRNIRCNIMELPVKLLKRKDKGRTIIRPESNTEFKRGRTH